MYEKSSANSSLNYFFFYYTYWPQVSEFCNSAVPQRHAAVTFVQLVRLFLHSGITTESDCPGQRFKNYSEKTLTFCKEMSKGC